MWAVNGQTTTVEGKVAKTTCLGHIFCERSDRRPQLRKTTEHYCSTVYHPGPARKRTIVLCHGPHADIMNTCALHICTFYLSILLTGCHTTNEPLQGSKQPRLGILLKPGTTCSRLMMPPSDDVNAERNMG